MYSIITCIIIRIKIGNINRNSKRSSRLLSANIKPIRQMCIKNSYIFNVSDTEA